MTTLKYNNAYGYGQQLSDKYHYSQTVRIPGNPNLIKISGQGGWDQVTGDILPPTTRENIQAQIEQAFANVQTALEAAGSKGWSDVYASRMFFVDWNAFDRVAIATMAECLRKWCPDHRPILTIVNIDALGLEAMRIEIEAEAYSVD